MLLRGRANPPLHQDALRKGTIVAFHPAQTLNPHGNPTHQAPQSQKLTLPRLLFPTNRASPFFSPWSRRSQSQPPLSMTVTGKAAKDMTVAVAGSTGYIGKFVAMECVRRGYKTIALTRNPDAVVEGAEMVVADVTDPASIEAALAGRKVGTEMCYKTRPFFSTAAGAVWCCVFLWLIVNGSRGDGVPLLWLWLWLKRVLRSRCSAGSRNNARVAAALATTPHLTCARTNATHAP